MSLVPPKSILGTAAKQSFKIVVRLCPPPLKAVPLPWFPPSKIHHLPLPLVSDPISHASVSSFFSSSLSLLYSSRTTPSARNVLPPDKCLANSIPSLSLVSNVSFSKRLDMIALI